MVYLPLAVQDGAALSIDLLGSCYTDQLRPPALAPHHLAQYQRQGMLTTAPAGGVGEEPSMASLSLSGDVSQLSLAGIESSMADASLHPATTLHDGQTTAGTVVRHGKSKLQRSTSIALFALIRQCSWRWGVLTADC